MMKFHLDINLDIEIKSLELATLVITLIKNLL